LGFSIDTNAEFRKDGYLFGEAQGRVIVSVKPSNIEEFAEFMATSGVSFTLLGEVNEGDFTVDGELFGDVHSFYSLYEGTLPSAMNYASN
jgi:phosphoribosylformylglycinamidine synthase